jgi:DNA-binding LacI/PurR family transcriptional regulator
MKVTIGDVAKKASVSKTTVSRILNGNFAHTTDDTREKVLQAIRELDYRPNALAKGLKSMKTNVIGIMLSNLRNPFWSTVLEGVEDTCRDLGYNLMICNSNENPEIEEEYIREFRMRQVDGIIINPTCKSPELYDKLIAEQYPMIVINRRIPNVDVHSVFVDNVKGAYIAVNHLLRYGRKKVAVCLYRDPYVSTWKERLEGYKKAMIANGLTNADMVVIELEQRMDTQKEYIMRYLMKNPDIDAIFSTNNMITLEIMGAIKEMNLRIPEQIAIVSYDDPVWAKHLDPPVTTIRQPGYQMGQRAAQNVIERIESEHDSSPSTVVLEPELIVRTSCGAIPRT